jgi:type II secretory pathway pseudopilin PulG
MESANEIALLVVAAIIALILGVMFYALALQRKNVRTNEAAMQRIQRSQQMQEELQGLQREMLAVLREISAKLDRGT